MKYPGKYDKYVVFEIFQKFIMMYRDELNSSLLSSEIDNVQSKVILGADSIENEKTENSITKEEISQNIKPKIKKETNWTNLLLGR